MCVNQTKGSNNNDDEFYFFEDYQLFFISQGWGLVITAIQ